MKPRSPIKRGQPPKRTALRYRPKTSTVAKKRGYAMSWNLAMDRAGWRCEVEHDGERCPRSSEALPSRPHARPRRVG